MAAGSKGYLNDIYWWLMVHGVFRFEGISSDEMCNAAEPWKKSITQSSVVRQITGFGIRPGAWLLRITWGKEGGATGRH